MCRYTIRRLSRMADSRHGRVHLGPSAACSALLVCLYLKSNPWSSRETNRWKGWINAIGTFQGHYQQNQLKEYSPSTVSWISSLETFCKHSAPLTLSNPY